MKDYRKELTGQVRGNARMRRRLKAKSIEILALRGHIGQLVTLFDTLGLGDSRPVSAAAAAIGWRRFDEFEVARFRREMEGLV
jgi:hypothetical protein